MHLIQAVLLDHDCLLIEYRAVAACIGKWFHDNYFKSTLLGKGVRWTEHLARS
jgi:hypothetical protein